MSTQSIIRTLFVAVTMMSAFFVDAQKRTVVYQETPQQAPVFREVYDYDFVDVQPTFPGGDSEMVKYINKNRVYPTEAYEKGIKGRVIYSFIVNTDGSISEISLLRGVEDSLNREAYRLIAEMPRWRAGKMGNVAVPVYCVLTIPFR
ncbi:MAG: TonB family protein [Muribaculaceae bacterium]|nr:TonB family protein [Muribaculaceae bacterium]MBR5744673.1 TonB family protein [Muribaculaceae bacterium]